MDKTSAPAGVGVTLTPNPQTNIPHKHLTTLGGGARVRVKS